MDTGIGAIAITGALGFTGQYTSRQFEYKGYEVLKLSSSPGNRDKTGAIYCDLTDKASILTALRTCKIRGVIHLAAESFVAGQYQARYYSVNTVGTINLLEAMDELKLEPSKVILASSANIYGNNTTPNLGETTKPAPVNHYGASKIAMEYLSKNWQSRFPIIVTRPFNYTGPGQPEKYVVPKLVKHFKSRAKQIFLGNLDIERDFSDVSDIATCYVNLYESDVHTETVNICSGRAISLQEILSQLKSMTNHDIEILVDPDLVRENDISHLPGSNEKLFDLTGYTPTPNLKNTLRAMLGNG